MRIMRTIGAVVEEKPVQRFTLTIALDTDDDPAALRALDPVDVGRAFADVLIDIDPFELREVEHCFVAKVTDIRRAG